MTVAVPLTEAAHRLAQATAAIEEARHFSGRLTPRQTEALVNAERAIAQARTWLIEGEQDDPLIEWAMDGER